LPPESSKADLRQKILIGTMATLGMEGLEFWTPFLPMYFLRIQPKIPRKFVTTK
jgi:hypothetical protein